MLKIAVAFSLIFAPHLAAGAEDSNIIGDDIEKEDYTVSHPFETVESVGPNSNGLVSTIRSNDLDERLYFSIDFTNFSKCDVDEVFLSIRDAQDVHAADVYLDVQDSQVAFGIRNSFFSSSTVSLHCRGTEARSYLVLLGTMQNAL